MGASKCVRNPSAKVKDPNNMTNLVSDTGVVAQPHLAAKGRHEMTFTNPLEASKVKTATKASAATKKKAELQKAADRAERERQLAGMLSIVHLNSSL